MNSSVLINVFSAKRVIVQRTRLVEIQAQGLHKHWYKPHGIFLLKAKICTNKTLCFYCPPSPALFTLHSSLALLNRSSVYVHLPNWST